MEVEVPAPSLPTVEQAREFLRLVNVGRVAGGLEPLELLDFDGAEPEAPCGCLSATNLVCALDDFASVGTIYFLGLRDSGRREAFAAAMGAMGANVEMTSESSDYWVIPAGILAVTDPFDARVDGLRERLVEAGVVAPVPDDERDPWAPTKPGEQWGGGSM
jgi:hypothetical protein